MLACSAHILGSRTLTLTAALRPPRQNRYPNEEYPNAELLQSQAAWTALLHRGLSREQYDRIMYQRYRAAAESGASLADAEIPSPASN
ncbi:hypothetical protein [Williamsia sp.]|uniref:hypothetical protein n=1 Tax=Williamsia sp. TaxID=1872085 RepID=UPI002F921955